MLTKGTFFHNINNLATKIQRFIMVTCSLTVTGIIFLAVLLRYVFHSDLYGYEEIVVIFAFWLYFIGGSYGSYTRTHITADVVSVYVPEGKLKGFLCVISSLITFLWSSFMAYWGFDFFMYGITEGAVTPVWRLPMAISYSGVFLGLLMMSLYFLVDLVEDINVLRGYYKDDQEEITDPEPAPEEM